MPDALANHLESLGLVLRLSKSAQVLSVDARPLAPETAAGIDDALVTRLLEFPRLKHLYLSGTAISDNCCTSLAQLRRLEVLELDQTRISDAGLEQIAGLPKLSLLSLNDTDVSREAVSQLRKRLLNCRIILL